MRGAGVALIKISSPAFFSRVRFCTLSLSPCLLDARVCSWGGGSENIREKKGGSQEGGFLLPARSLFLPPPLRAASPRLAFPGG